MRLPYFLKNKLNKITSRIENQKKVKQEKGLTISMPQNGAEIMCQVSAAFIHYQNATQKRTAWLASFVPGTKAFRLRIDCAIKIQQASLILDIVDKEIKEAEKKQKAAKVKKANITPSSSYDKDEKIYPSPIGLGKKSNIINATPIIAVTTQFGCRLS